MNLIPQNILELLATFSFRGNKNLRPENSEIEYTKEMVDEYRKCKNDPIYFIKKYIKITHVDKGIIPFELFPYQEKMILGYHNNRRCITLLFRQAGKTTTSAAYLTWYVIFNDDKTVAVMANKAAVAKEILSRMQMAYENLPLWLQQGVKTWNKTSFELENGSRVISAATSSSGLRGYSISLLYLDELAHLQNNIAEDFFTSMFPTLSSGKETKILISSTPNGFNMFQKMWVDAENGRNGFVPLRFDWWEHPERDQKWADEQKAILGELKYNQEVLMTFLGSSKTLLNSETLSRLSFDEPIKEFNDQFKGLKVYTNPIPKHAYSITVDVSRGRHLDYSTFIIFDITSYPHRIVATYRNNEIAPMLYASVIEAVAKKYNTAYCLIETNDIGGQVADIMWNQLEYEQMYFSKGGSELGKTGADKYPGVRTTTKTKRIGCATLKDMIENNQLIVNDLVLIQELSTFIQNNTGSYAADQGFTDDMCMAAVIHAWSTTQPYFMDLTNSDLRASMHNQHIQEMEDSIMLVGGFSDGTDYYEEDNSRF